MDILDRYLIREFLIYFLLVLASLALVFLGVDFLSRYWGMNMSVSKAVTIYSYRLPAILQQFVPVACLMAMLLVLTAMSRQNEILALYSSGVGSIRILSTFVAVVATISTISFLTFDSLVPTFKKKEILFSHGLDPSQEQMLYFNKTQFWTRSGRVIYNVGRFIPDTNMLEDIHIYVLSPSFYLTEKIQAKRAKFVNNEWILENGFSLAFPRDTRFPIPSIFAQKKAPFSEKPGDFKTLRLEEQTMRLKDLRHYIKRNSSYGLDTIAQQVHYHERVALIFAPLILIMIAVPFAIKPLKIHSTAKSIGFCFLVVFLYLLMFRLTLSVGKGGHLPPAIAAWSTNAVFMIGSLALIAKSK